MTMTTWGTPEVIAATGLDLRNAGRMWFALGHGPVGSGHPLRWTTRDVQTALVIRALAGTTAEKRIPTTWAARTAQRIVDAHEVGAEFAVVNYGTQSFICLHDERALAAHWQFVGTAAIVLHLPTLLACTVTPPGYDRDPS
jgi:hypothetical protein